MLSPIEATESAAVQSPLVCIALLSKMIRLFKPSCFTVCNFAHACSPHNAQYSTSIHSTEVVVLLCVPNVLFF